MCAKFLEDFYKICYIMPLFKEVVIGLKFVNSSYEIMHTYNRQH